VIEILYSLYNVVRYIFFILSGPSMVVPAKNCPVNGVSSRERQHLPFSRHLEWVFLHPRAGRARVCDESGLFESITHGDCDLLHVRLDEDLPSIGLKATAHASDEGGLYDTSLFMLGLEVGIWKLYTIWDASGGHAN